MSARKYGAGGINSVITYGRSSFLQASRIPGFREFTDIYQFLLELNPTKASPEELEEKAKIFAVDFFRSRTIPAIISDISKGTDRYEREVDKNDYLGQIMSRIPVLREKLPRKVNVFGEDVQEESFWGSVLFGSRIRTVNETKLINELTRLEQKGQMPAITDVRKTSSRAKELKEKIGEKKFQEFYREFGSRLKAKLVEATAGSTYTSADDEGKKKIIEKVKDEQFESTLERYGYQNKRKQELSTSSIFRSRL
jgi:hypothetical protein